MFKKLFDSLQGRTTTFLIFFTLAGTLLHIWGKLSPTYISFVITIMGFVIGHSIKEDVVQSLTQTTTTVQTDGK